MNLNHLQKIRKYELTLVLPELPEGSKILEIGAGSGWQAKLISEKGFQVIAIDVVGSNYSEDRIWPVIIYDGKTIPFITGYFDVIFSSCVLEHIPKLEAFQREIHRVLKNDGIAIHILPDSVWRIWSNITHYLWVIIRILMLITNKINLSQSKISTQYTNNLRHHSAKELLKFAFFPPTHGEAGNFVTEIYWFHRKRWKKEFNKTGWRIVKYFPTTYFILDMKFLDDTGQFHFV